MNLFKETRSLDLGMIWYQNNYTPSPNWAGTFLILKHKHPTCLMFTIRRLSASDGSPATAKEREQTGKHQTLKYRVLWRRSLMFSDDVDHLPYLHFYRSHVWSRIPEYLWDLASVESLRRTASVWSCVLDEWSGVHLKECAVRRSVKIALMSAENFLFTALIACKMLLPLPFNT